MPERYAICCAAEISPEAMNRFIQAEQARNNGTEYEDIQFFVFVDDMHKPYNEGPGDVVELPSSPDSPFVGKTLEECFALLKELPETTTSDIDLDAFAVMDERSMEDDTVLIVNSKSGCQSVRAEFAVAVAAMMCWMTGHSSVDQDIYDAERTEDGVLRWGKS